MSEPTPTPDTIERANALFWSPPSLDELMVDVAPLSEDESFEIEGLTDDEWQAFVDALDE
ncbi:MAG: hypothetical protein AB1673_05725 [Actinomycetota bacterium]|jgi:hypothetical protein